MGLLILGNVLILGVLIMSGDSISFHFDICLLRIDCAFDYFILTIFGLTKLVYHHNCKPAIQWERHWLLSALKLVLEV